MKLLTTSAKTLFPIRSRSWVLGIGTWTQPRGISHDTGTQGWGWSTPGEESFLLGVLTPPGPSTSHLVRGICRVFPKMGFQSAPYKPLLNAAYPGGGGGEVSLGWAHAVRNSPPSVCSSSNAPGVPGAPGYIPTSLWGQLWRMRPRHCD